MYKTERICRLCLGVSDTDFEIIDDVAKGTLDVLLLKIDISLAREPIMCKNCAVSLQKSFDLLSTCQNTKDSIFPFGVNGELDTNVDIRKAKSTNSLGNAECKSCRFCMQVVSRGFYSPLYQLEEDMVALKDALPTSIFDLYVTATEEPVLCNVCHSSMRDHFTYLKNSLEVERKIKSYYKLKEVDSKDPVDLYNVRQFTLTGEITIEDKSVVKTDNKLYWNEQDVTSEILLKKEENEDAVKQEPEVVDVMPCSNMGHVVENHSTHIENASQQVFYKCHTCSYDTTHKHYILWQASTQPENASEPLLYKCHVCSYVTPNKRYLFGHLSIHKTDEVYKCSSCPYQTTNKVYFRRHSMVHKDKSELRMHKCDICEFQTRHKSYLNTHLLLHKTASETTIYKCESCSYETKNEKNLKRHLLNHYDVPQYKCEECSYVTNQKVCLRRHSITHKSPSEITMYKCDVCSYTTRHKKNHTLHALLHKDDSEVTMYYCDSCPYKTKTKHNLKLHVVVHKSNADVKLYKCTSCSYETKRYNNLQQHLVVHKKPSEIEMYRCDLCSYETKRKTNLKQHVLTHNKTSQVGMYRCEKCSYESRRKSSLKQHSLTQHSASDDGADVDQGKHAIFGI